MVKIVNFLALVFSLIVISCANTQDANKNIATILYDDSIVIEPTLKKFKSLPLNYDHGKIIQPFFHDSLKIEQNLVLQANAYNRALLHGDIEACSNYLYPDAIIYCREYFPGYSDAEIINELYKEVSGGLGKTLLKGQRSGIFVELVVAKLERKVVYEDTIFIVFYVSSNVCLEDVSIHSVEYEKTLGISNDGGKNWWFMSGNTDLPTILQKKYTQNVVNEVMGY